MCLEALLHCLCAWLLLTATPVCSIALPEVKGSLQDPNSPSGDSDQLQTTTSPSSAAATVSPPPPPTASPIPLSSLSPAEQRRAMLESIRRNILAKLDLENEEADISSAARLVSPDQLSSYRAQLQALQQQEESGPQKCRSEKTTLFSRHPRFYYPNHFVSVPPNANRFQLDSEAGVDGKGEEVKVSSKDQKASSSTTDSKESDDKSPESSLSPVQYSLTFGDLDLERSDRIWSAELQLYKRKAPILDAKRGMNPVETVQVYRVVRTPGQLKRYVHLASKNVRSEDDGYVSFNITSGVKRWLDSSPVDVTTMEIDVLIDTPRRVDNGLSFPPSVKFDIPSRRNGQRNARLMVERLNEIENSASATPFQKRRKRQTTTPQGAGKDYCFSHPNETNCCIKELTVNLQQELPELNILLPTTFQPNYCQGQCVDPTWPHAATSTNYLMMLRQSNPTAAPEPCCVAHKTRPLTVLMTLGEQTLIREIPDMIVDSCICR